MTSTSPTATSTASLAGGLDHSPRTRLVMGPGVVERVGELALELLGESHNKSVLLVTDPGLVQAGHAQITQNALGKSGLHVEVFADTHENPTTRDVDACLAVARQCKPALIVALGGGSALDTAKGYNFVYTNGGNMSDYHGVGKANKPMLPLIAIPTTSGTGSETQSFALIAKADTHEKMACGDPKAAARVALLDPQLTTTQPHAVTCAAGIDAISHAVEAYVCTRRNALSSMFAAESLRHTLHQLPEVLADSQNMDARASMLWGAALAGLAIENSMLGAAHAAANPLTARHGITHGQAVGVMLPHVVRFNAEDPTAAAHYQQLCEAVHLSDAHGLADCLEQRLHDCGFPASLSEWAIPATDLAELSLHACEQWTGKFNPRPMTPESFRLLYQQAGLC